MNDLVMRYVALGVHPLHGQPRETRIAATVMSIESQIIQVVMSLSARMYVICWVVLGPRFSKSVNQHLWKTSDCHVVVPTSIPFR